MSIFGAIARSMKERRQRRADELEAQRRSVVRVNYQALEIPFDSAEEQAGGYAFDWTIPIRPEVGMRVRVPGAEGTLKPAVIIGFGRNGYTGSLKRVRHAYTPDEISAAIEKAEQDKTAWLNMARRAAGLPTPGRARKSPPKGYPEIAPTDGHASHDAADGFGRMWWRARRLAMELERDEDEIKAFSSLAHRWFAIRDREKP